MPKTIPFIKELLTEIRIWTEKGIISPEQREKIEALYVPGPEKKPEPSAAPGKSQGLNITGVIIALASLCLAIGIIIFYAANWKKMPPTFKLIQVFLLVIVSYAGAAHFLFTESASRKIGRALLFVGMCSFGAAIMLVAQIYHISAHPTNGMLAWAVGVFAMAVLMKDKAGFILSALLFFIWYVWETSVFHNPAYLYLIYIAVSTGIYIKQKEKAGITASLCFLIFFFYNTVAPAYFRIFDEAAYIFNFGLLNIPVACVLYGGGLFLRKYEIFKPAAVLANVSGMVIFTIALCSVSWPGKFGDAGVLRSLDHGDYRFFIQYTAFTLAAAGTAYLLFRSKRDFLFLCVLLVFPVISAFLPMGLTQPRMISSHIAIVFLAFALPYLAYNGKENIGINRAFAFMFAFTMIIVKGIGFFALSIDSHEYKTAYLSGFVIFAIVCLLLNALTAHLSRRNGREYPSGILHSLCVIMIWLILYAASFETGPQKTIFSASDIVIAMIILFSVIAIALIILLSRILREKKIIVYDAAIIFAMTLVTMFSARPSMSWIFYSVMFNAMLIILTAVYIHYSAVTRSKAVLNLAVIAFAVIIITRYFDLFWDMLSGSLLFILTGIFGLLFGYLLEQKRRKMSKRIEGTSTPDAADRGGKI
jgi:uncharacterized membrane protein